MVGMTLGILSFQDLHLITRVAGMRRRLPVRWPHGSSDLHSRIKTAEVEFDLVRSDACEVEIPIDGSYEEGAANYVAESGRDHRFPDIQTDTDVRMSVEDRGRDEVHVGNNVIKAKSDECECGPPNSSNS